jgi:GTPase SAR1 family protein
LQTPENLADINVVVLGAEGVGKSTFVQKALDVPYPVATRAAERKISVKGSDYFVRLLEVSIDDADWDDDDETVVWPETIDDKMMPRIDGALVLYDIIDASSLEKVREMLSKCMSQAGLPAVQTLYQIQGVVKLLLIWSLHRGNKQNRDTLGFSCMQV